ncbi:ShlB/FhaC/HecB family hemolysin secretion/activation protein [Rhodoferax sp.]|uniref:ShlB/FhaC/HecB family hemolysin secretion/activation protein n=1 Tax=Rhodoferax sp. TaxID=50421 RepID=UPI0027196EA7|nr:ShlB/FhaC/HecB family hemolysin secretion/activation protein [Rhodoferax sp.]MDO9143463.1 ShlB/FhaC/HecB family hemolysin secretion/activation protein [Rhodoferax sp.]MDP1530195.1 ShlB/FhaC/HecB family hemolysin secretion/activation protein [Rhodoferax sp.]MDP1943459.1 ShlB/FhaC/HecB family hemolysin secretion/activation protein [Rhodoferax sp.]MDP2441368.1 ShlB/FhaC/HecB family hemolysin secretion/activation protein [Rhodoferax sp.]MDP3863565.1 ShlB/FhaC/HecB family hemolysin secretion/act
MFNLKLLPLAMLVLSPAAFAATPLGAGGQMQQIPPPPQPQSVAPAFEVKPTSQPVAAPQDSAKIIVNRLQVTGAQIYTEARLLEVTGFVPGSSLSLTDLQGMAARIATYYRQNGYFVAQAYVPAQEIQGGVVTIAVIEGQYGKVSLNNQTNVSNALANDLLAGINSGDVVATAPLENRLLLLSDLPGVRVNSSLVPGATPGSSDLIVNLTPGKRVSGSIDADNAGNYYTGANRVGATVNFNEPLGLGDVASLRVLTSGSGLHYARGSYQLQLGKATVGVAYSALDYELSRGVYEGKGYNGTTKIASLYGSYPLVRSRNSNLSAALVYEDKTFEDKIDAMTYRDKEAQVLTASLYGNERDNLGGGGVTGYSLALSAGNIDNDNPGEINGRFSKLGFNLSRVQRVTDTVSLSAVVNGQLASRALDSSEQMELGGMYGVRAYPEGEGYGDAGLVLNLEARWQVPKFSNSLPGQLQLIGFVDAGTVRPRDAGERRTLSGAGVGFNWYETNNFMVRAYYAVKIGNEAATSAPDKSGRFWIQAVKYF